jgi:hypothetical protein
MGFFFRFSVTAPASPGSYQFQWRMVHEGVEWFGEFTPSSTIAVAGLPISVRVEPYPMPVNKQTQTIVHVTDTSTGAQLSGTARIINPGSTGQNFPTNTSFPFTFGTKTTTIPSPDGPVRKITFPTGYVTVPGGYPQTPIDFGWASPE